MQIESKTIFLSHASKDKELADRLAELLTNGCGVSPNEILCTSLEGKGIPAGTPDFIEYLRGQIREPKLVVLLLSENYFASLFCVCELGAVWGMGLPCFPLVVPPTDKSRLKATLAVTQAGDITNSSYLDELPDVVKRKVGHSVPIATWNVKRDAFLKRLDDIIKSLPVPALVPIEKLTEAESKYEVAIGEIASKEKDIKALKAQIADLEKCKDRDQVDIVARKYSTADEVFDGLCAEAKTALRNLKSATQTAIFYDMRGDTYRPQDRDAWREVDDAKVVEEVYDHEMNAVKTNRDHPGVQEAYEAIAVLREFLDDEKNTDFVERLKRQYRVPITIRNKTFWEKFLVRV